MRFKATVQGSRLDSLSGLVQSMEKVGDTCAILLGENTIELATREDSDVENVHMLVTLHQDNMFTKFRIESKTDNQICFTTNTTILSRALKSAGSARQSDGKEVHLKLAKKHNRPHLCVESTVDEMSIYHEIPIHTVTPAMMKEWYPPKIAQPHIVLGMPQLRQFRSVLDRMKTIAQFAVIKATQQGTLEVSVETDELTIKTFYRMLEVRELEDVEDSQGSECESREECAIKISMKKLHKVLHCQMLTRPQTILCCITESQAMQWHVDLGEIGDIAYVIPVLSIVEDD